MGASISRVYTTGQVEEMRRRDMESDDSEMDDDILLSSKYASFARFSLTICCTVAVITAILFVSLIIAAEFATNGKSQD
ncbi:hypothetical protein CRE_31205 [Caenorhabditis remanei]|uniref:Uncharacterized protein n=1 Tax=Caenorhabditis remanei TaxID=31234 RepID=E3MLK3_CAERE|nr:hypothetical protein CRE_31205 [Caenorhabditis remanei]